MAPARASLLGLNHGGPLALGGCKDCNGSSRLILAYPTADHQCPPSRAGSQFRLERGPISLTDSPRYAMSYHHSNTHASMIQHLSPPSQQSVTDALVEIDSLCNVLWCGAVGLSLTIKPRCLTESAGCTADGLRPAACTSKIKLNLFSYFTIPSPIRR